MAYARFFIPLENEAAGYDFRGRTPTGRCIVEDKGGMGKLSVWVQDLKPETRYSIYLIFADGGRYAGVLMGALAVDARGKSDSRWYLDDLQLCGFVLTTIVAVAVVAADAPGVVSPLCGYRDRPVSWRSGFHVPAKPVEMVAVSPEELAALAAPLAPAASRDETPPEPQPEERLEAPPEIWPEAQPELRAEIPPEAPPEARVEIQPETPPEARLEIPPEPPPEARLEIPPEARLEIPPEPQPKSPASRGEAAEEQPALPRGETIVEPLFIPEPKPAPEPPAPDAAIPEPMPPLAGSAAIPGPMPPPAGSAAIPGPMPPAAGSAAIPAPMSPPAKGAPRPRKPRSAKPAPGGAIAQEFRASLRELNEETLSRSPARAESIQMFNAIFGAKEPVSPFVSQSRETKWVRFALTDRVPLPHNRPLLLEEPFVRAAYANHDHLILGITTDDGPGQYIIGVPGEYSPDLRVQARRLGFSQFKSNANEPPKRGDGGYWLMFVSL